MYRITFGVRENFLEAVVVSVCIAAPDDLFAERFFQIIHLNLSDGRVVVVDGYEAAAEVQANYGNSEFPLVHMRFPPKFFCRFYCIRAANRVQCRIRQETCVIM